MIELSGETGVLKVGYKIVADLKKWKLIRPESSLGSSTSTLRSFTGNVDSFWINQSAPFSLELNMGGAKWIWTNIRGVTYTDGILFVLVEGNPESRAEERAHVTQPIRCTNVNAGPTFR